MTHGIGGIPSPKIPKMYAMFFEKISILFVCFFRYFVTFESVVSCDVWTSKRKVQALGELLEVAGWLSQKVLLENGAGRGWPSSFIHLIP